MPVTEHLPLPASALGTARHLTVHRFGTPGARPKVYIQAGLHADELPGLVVIETLLPLLRQAEAEGRVTGEVVVVPVANPIGLDQSVQGSLLGRFDLADGLNFNRHYPDFTDTVARRAGALLGSDPQANIALIRALLREEWAASRQKAVSEGQGLRHLLYGLAFDADLVLDLHCDWEAVLHAYTSTASWPQVEPVTRLLGAEAVLLADESGDHPFDEALSLPWVQLNRRFADRAPIPQGCHSLTVELRGQTDITAPLARQDAAALEAVLRHWGAIAGETPPLPPALCQATPLDGVDMVRAPGAGIIVYAGRVGDRVEDGQVLGWVVNPLAETRAEIRAGTAGIVYGRLAQRLVHPGDVICKVAGQSSLPHRKGKLLTA